MMSDTLQKARDYEARYSGFIRPEDRPVFHLTPRIGWMNDPNGFSVYRGEYHLFYQYHPYSLQWGPMHWGHAVSRDLLRWRYLPAALAPDRDCDADGCFSGSAIELEDGRQMLLYTGTRQRLKEDGTRRTYQTQCLAFGDGTDYEKAEGGPVIDESLIPEGYSRHDFRDPKLFRTPEGFGCVIGSRRENGTGAVLLYESPDGVHWRFVTVLDHSFDELGRMWECPDLFTLDGTDVLLVSPQDMSQVGLEFHNGNGTVCLLGHYSSSDRSFRREHVQAVDYGIDFYAPQTMESPDGRRIMIGWMQNWDTCASVLPDAKWFGQMSLPRELRVREGRLIQTPVRELEALRGRRVAYQNVPVREETVLIGVYGRVLDMTVDLRPQSSDGYELFRIRFARGSQHYASVSYCPRSSTLRISRAHSGLCRDFVHERECLVRDRGGRLRLRIVLDRYSAEFFVNDGEQALSMTFYTPLTANGISFEAHGPVMMDVEKYDLSL